MRPLLLPFGFSLLLGVIVGATVSARATPQCPHYGAVATLEHVRTTIDGEMTTPGPRLTVTLTRAFNGHQLRGSTTGTQLFRVDLPDGAP